MTSHSDKHNIRIIGFFFENRLHLILKWTKIYTNACFRLHVYLRTNKILILLLLQSALQPLVGFRPSQLPLSILSRKVLESSFASGKLNPPTWRRTRDLERFNFRHKRPPASEATLANPTAEGGTMGEKLPRNFAERGDFHVTFGFFYMP
jgi:hypothetical protein